MKPDPFEEQLSRQPFRSVPPEWRQAILTRAEAVVDSREPEARRGASQHGRLRDWLWPHPVAWAALAACWVAILTLDRLAAPSAAELAHAHAGARIAEAVFAASRSPQAAELIAPSIQRPAIDRSRRDPADQGRIEHGLRPHFV